jgi:hypothetical protein
MPVLVVSVVKYVRAGKGNGLQHPGLLCFQKKVCKGIVGGLVLLVPGSYKEADFYSSVEACVNAQSEKCRVVHVGQEDLGKLFVLNSELFSAAEEEATEEYTAILLPMYGQEDLENPLVSARKLLKELDESVHMGLSDFVLEKAQPGLILSKEKVLPSDDRAASNTGPAFFPLQTQISDLSTLSRVGYEVINLGGGRPRQGLCSSCTIL